jgi:hypothetical protein
MSEKGAMQKVMDAIKAKRDGTSGLAPLNNSDTEPVEVPKKDELTEYEKALLELKDQEG